VRDGSRRMSEHNAAVLIVDDAQNIVEYLSSLMRTEGFKTLHARDGKTALELIASQKPDVMLLDIKLLDMDGMEVLRQTEDIDKNLPIIVITGYSETSSSISIPPSIARKWDKGGFKVYENGQKSKRERRVTAQERDFLN